jgi:hypothetical protein
MMPTLTEQFNELAGLMEADAKRDAATTKKVNAFANKVIKHLKSKKVGQTLKYEANVPGIGSDALHFWLPFNKGDFARVRFYLAPVSATYGGTYHSRGVGKMQPIVLYILPTDVDLRDYQAEDPLTGLYSQNSRKLKVPGWAKDTLVHELIHFLDFDRGPGLHGKKGSSQHMGTEKQGLYYNDPVEFNAYYQQGQNVVQKALRKLLSDLRKGKDQMMGEQVGRNYNGFIKWVYGSWRPKWITNLDGKFLRKFKKRLYALYQHIRPQVLKAYEQGFGGEIAFLSMETAKGRQKYQQSSSHREWPMKGSPKLIGTYRQVGPPDPRLFIPGK